MVPSSPMLEAQVHHWLRQFLRERATSNWSHHLTMARIVSRALRLGRSALIQTASPSSRYCFSYLVPALLSDRPVLLVAPAPVQRYLRQVVVPQLQEELATGEESQLLFATPPDWLGDRLQGGGRFPPGIPTLIDGADALETWARDFLEAPLGHQDWEELMQEYPERAGAIRDLRVQLTKAIFARPKNPYECYLLEAGERESLGQLLGQLAAAQPVNPALSQFWQQWQAEDQMLWASLNRSGGQFTLHLSPVEVATSLSAVWQQQPVVVMGSFLDHEEDAAIYRQQLGLGKMLCLKFAPNRQHEAIQLYLPERLPLPNTPEFPRMLLEQCRTLLHLCSPIAKPVVVLVEDVPLKAQIGTQLAAEFGSRVQVEKVNLAAESILVSGWQFWQAHQGDFPTPQLLIVAALPLPSLENPLVAGRVAYYKGQRQDWFRLYLLPAALRELQRAVLPLRESQGLVALLDSRVNSRSYGSQILQVLSPYARISYLEPTWFAGTSPRGGQFNF